jgi:acetaldehyde dehydrogenase (acetylating)
MSKQLKVAIIGTGNIGTDLLIKLSKTKNLIPVIFSGKRSTSIGISIAKELGVLTTDEGINFFIKNVNFCEVVFDCTNAIDAKYNYEVFRKQGIKVIDLTPSKLGEFCIPDINPEAIILNDNVNMVTCGGQASIPLLNTISNFSKSIDYIEVVSQISSKSAGPGTRINIDEYIYTTEAAIKKFTKTKDCKVILNLNPAEPCVNMQTTMFIDSKDDIFTNELVEAIYKKLIDLSSYISKCELLIPPTINEDGILILSTKLTGNGDYLPSYAGNLDVINCASIKVAEQLIKNE